MSKKDKKRDVKNTKSNSKNSNNGSNLVTTLYFIVAGIINIMYYH